MKFNINDKVRLISARGGTRNKIGDIGIITEIKTNYNKKISFRVSVKGRDYFSNFSYEEDLELVIDKGELLSEVEELLEILKNPNKAIELASREELKELSEILRITNFPLLINYRDKSPVFPTKLSKHSVENYLRFYNLKIEGTIKYSDIKQEIINKYKTK